MHPLASSTIGTVVPLARVTVEALLFDEEPVDPVNPPVMELTVSLTHLLLSRM